MVLSDLAKLLREISYNLVVIRARQYPRENGTGGSTKFINSGSVTKKYRTFIVDTEIQAIACHTLEYGGKKNGMIKLSYHDFSTPNSELVGIRSEVWTGESDIIEKWPEFCDSWIEVPVWMSKKPVIFTRQFHPEDEYTTIPLSDLVFLRYLDRFIYEAKSHKKYLDYEMKRLAQNTPINQRSGKYKDALREFNTKSSLLSTIVSRLSTFTDGQFGDLATNLGIVKIEPFNAPFE